MTATPAGHHVAEKEEICVADLMEKIGPFILLDILRLEIPVERCTALHNILMGR